MKYYNTKSKLPQQTKEKLYKLMVNLFVLLGFKNVWSSHMSTSDCDRSGDTCDFTTLEIINKIPNLDMGGMVDGGTCSMDDFLAV